METELRRDTNMQWARIVAATGEANILYHNLLGRDATTMKRKIEVELQKQNP